MDPRIDLSPLDPDHDPSWRRHLVSSVMARVSSLPPPDSLGVARRGMASDVLALARPSLAAAALLTAAALTATVLPLVTRGHPPASAALESRLLIADALGIPEPISRWADGRRLPTPVDLLALIR